MNFRKSMNRMYRRVRATVRDVWIPPSAKTFGQRKRSCRTVTTAVVSLEAAFEQAGAADRQVAFGAGSITYSGAIAT
jgi:hypothetical protein